MSLSYRERLLDEARAQVRLYGAFDVPTEIELADAGIFPDTLRDRLINEEDKTQ